MRSMAFVGWGRIATLAALALGIAGCAQPGQSAQPGAANRPTYTPRVVRTARPAGPKPTTTPTAPAAPAAEASPPPSEPAAAPAAEATPPAAPAGQADAASLREAVMRSLSSQRLQVTMDSLDDGTAVRLDGSPAVLEEHFAAQFNGEDHQATVRGTTYTEAGYDPERGLDMIVAGGKTYIHGPAPAAKAPEDRWYLYPGKLPIDVANLWRLLLFPMAQPDSDLSGFAPAGEEELDGQQCRVFAHNDAASRAAGEAPGREVRSAELRMWVCADGYVHKLLADASYGPAPNSPNPASKRIDLRLFDFDAVAPIAAPADAAPIAP